MIRVVFSHTKGPFKRSRARTCLTDPVNHKQAIGCCPSAILAGFHFWQDSHLVEQSHLTNICVGADLFHGINTKEVQGRLTEFISAKCQLGL